MEKLFKIVLSVIALLLLLFVCQFTFASTMGPLPMNVGKNENSSKYYKVDIPLDGWMGNYYYQNGDIVKNKWEQYGGNWYYCGSDGAIVKNTWVNDGDDWYYCGYDGVMLKGQWIDNIYYVDSTGKMLKNATTPDGYKVGIDGKYYKDENKSKEKTSIFIDDYNENIGYAKFDKDGNLWILGEAKYSSNGPGNGITIKYLDGRECYYEETGYASPYDGGGHYGFYTIVEDGIKKTEETVGSFDAVGEVSKKVKEIFNKYRRMSDNY